jgi:multiple sugar transport system substrate-binding protein
MTKYGKGAIELSDFDKNQLAQGTVGGKLFGVSLGGNIAATLYNKTVLQKAGLQPPPEDVTWDQFASYCAKLAKKLPSGVYPSDDPSGSIPPFESWIRQQNRDLWTSDGKLAFTADDVSSSSRAVWPPRRLRTGPARGPRSSAARPPSPRPGQISSASTRS